MRGAPLSNTYLDVVPPSSLIFVVILAVWAAYFVQHWVRRRDHIATARSVDRFSEAMRVLERRHPRAGVDFSTPVPRSYAVSPARPSAPEVVVKHAQPPAAAFVSHGGVAGERSTTTAVLSPSSAPITAARNRGVMLLVAAAVMVLSTGLSMIGVLPWWTALMGVGVLVGALFAVRVSVRRAARPMTGSTAGGRVSVRDQDISSRPEGAHPGAAEMSSHSSQASIEARRRQAERRVAVRRSAAAAGGGAAATVAATVQAEADELRDMVQESVAAAVQPSPSSAVYDVEAVEQVIATASAAEVNAAPASVVDSAAGPKGASVTDRASVVRGASDTWQPVPVPPPTYTLKAKAPSRVLPSEIPADGTIVALEEEDEELPAAIRDLA